MDIQDYISLQLVKEQTYENEMDENIESIENRIAQ